MSEEEEKKENWIERDNERHRLGVEAENSTTPNKRTELKKIKECLYTMFDAELFPTIQKPPTKSEIRPHKFKEALTQLAFDICAQKDQLEEITTTEFNTKFRKLRNGLSKTITEMKVSDLEPFLKEIDWEHYSNGGLDDKLDFSHFDRNRLSKDILAKIQEYSDLISKIEKRRLENPWRQGQETNQSKVREREIAILILGVFQKNGIPLPESVENKEVSNTRFRKVLGEIFRLLKLSREPKWAADHALAHYKNKL